MTIQISLWLSTHVEKIKKYINKLFRFVYNLDSIVQLVCLPFSFEESMITILPPPSRFGHMLISVNFDSHAVKYKFQIKYIFIYFSIIKRMAYPVGETEFP